MALALSRVPPFLPAFSAGNMIKVVTGEWIPASAASCKGPAAVGVMAGFLMMTVPGSPLC